MRFLAAILLIGVALRHMGASLLSSITGIPVAGVFYILGGALETMLCGALILLLITQAKSRYRDLSIAAASIGAIEGFQISACRLAIRDIAQVPKDMTLCTYATGLPTGAALITLYAIILWLVIR